MIKMKDQTLTLPQGMERRRAEGKGGLATQETLMTLMANF